MIRSFRDRRTRLFYEEGRVPRQWRAFEEAAVRKLFFLETATRLEDLRNPPGNRLEKLRGDRAGQYSIRINSQWRVCFKWIDGAAGDVEIVDYH
ncbi:MAG: type II toxin-antitoxin system RelE/ParE family toxin [Sphingomonadales bacterium]|nr:type II toxin-antitoxin system RelE/ParE family toxin [Sphingomonadales bacterium]